MPVASAEQAAVDDVLRRIDEDLTASRARLRAELVHQTRLARTIENRPRRTRLREGAWITIDGRITAHVDDMTTHYVLLKVLDRNYTVPRADLERHFTYTNGRYE
jgi:hypothetical protein